MLLTIIMIHSLPCIKNLVANCKQIENNDFSKLTVYFMKHDNVS